MIRVIPRARKNEFVGFMADGRLKIRLQAPPLDNKANRSLIKFLSGLLGISRSRISIVAGSSSRDKRVAIDGFSTRELNRIIKNF